MTDLITPMHVWERQADESEVAYAAFREYLNTRNITQASRNIGKERSQLNAWASKYAWADRALAWDNTLIRKADEKQRGDILDLQAVVVTQEMNDYKLLHKAWQNDLEAYLSDENNLELVDRTAVFRRLIMSREALATLVRRGARMPMTFGASKDDVDPFSEDNDIILDLNDEPKVD